MINFLNEWMNCVTVRVEGVTAMPRLPRWWEATQGAAVGRVMSLPHQLVDFEAQVVCSSPIVYALLLLHLLFFCCICSYPIVNFLILLYMLLSCCKCSYPIVYAFILLHMLLSYCLCSSPIEYALILLHMLFSYCILCSWFRNPLSAIH